MIFTPWLDASLGPFTDHPALIQSRTIMISAALPNCVGKNKAPLNLIREALPLCPWRTAICEIE